MKNNHTEERTYTKQTEQREPGLRTIHITRDLFCDWQEGKLKEPEETDFFTHVGACTFCAEQFGSWMEEGFLEYEEPGRQMISDGESEKCQLFRKTVSEEPPRYLKEEILSRTRQLNVQASVKLKETSRQVQLMIYSLKVGLAVTASIFLLTVTANVQNMDRDFSENYRTEQAQESQEREESVVGRLKRHSKEITGLLNDISSGLFRIEMDDSVNERNQEVTR